VLGDNEADLGKLEHLSTFSVDDLGVFQARSARRARWRCVVDHVVGIGHLGQVLARRSGLLTLLAGRGPTLGTRWRRRFGESFGRWWHGRVAGIAADTFTKIGHLRPQRSDLRRLRRHHALQLTDQCDQLVVGRSVRGGIAGRNSPRYARR